jgi:hypothetical protein
VNKRDIGNKRWRNGRRQVNSFDIYHDCMNVVARDFLFSFAFLFLTVEL